MARRHSLEVRTRSSVSIFSSLSWPVAAGTEVVESIPVVDAIDAKTTASTRPSNSDASIDAYFCPGAGQLCSARWLLEGTLDGGIRRVAQNCHLFVTAYF